MTNEYDNKGKAVSEEDAQLTEEERKIRAVNAELAGKTGVILIIFGLLFIAAGVILTAAASATYLLFVVVGLLFISVGIRKFRENRKSGKK